jgi:predicted outer membrane repeat protein
MDGTQFDRRVQRLVTAATRRGVLRLVAALPLTGALATFASGETLEAKRRKHGHRHGKGKHKGNGKGKCGKAGGKPPKGKSCCQGLVLADGACQRCDVCASGCDFDSVETALEAADAGDTILLCSGEYAVSLDLAKNVTLIGDGDGGTTMFAGFPGSVVTIHAGATVTLQNLRITGGGGPDTDGGGIYNEGTANLIGCTVTGNTVESFGVLDSFGGGIANIGGTLSLTDSVVSENAVTHFGGGIYNQAGTLLLTGSSVTGNAAAFGGGIRMNGGTLFLTDSTMTGNTATYGGAIHTSGTTVTFDADSRVTGNTATNGGGGIYHDGGTVTLASTESVTGNTPNNCAGDGILLCDD